MSKKITDLASITTPDAADVVPLVDTSASTTKKTTITGIANAAATAMDAGAIAASKLDADAIGHGMVIIARATLGSPADTITVSSIPARTYLRVIFKGIATGGTIDTSIRLDNNSSTVYAYRASNNGSAMSDNVSQTAFAADSGATDSGQMNHIVMEILNVAGQEKSVMFNGISQDATGGANVPVVYQSWGKFAVTSGQVSRIDWINVGTGDFAAGSEIVVWGRN